MKTVRLGDVATASGSKAGAAEYPVYSVTKHRGFVPSENYFKKRVYSADTAKYKVVRSGEFAYATIHLDEGSIGIAPEDCVVSPMYTVFSVDSEKVIPEYLLYFMKSNQALREYGSMGNGSAHRRRSIPFKVLSNLEVPLPSLDEQRRIAGILDSVSRRIDDNNVLVNRYERLLTGLVGRFQEGADLVPLADLGEIQGGLQVTSKRADHPISAPYLRVANVFRGRIDTTEIKTMRVTERELGRVSLVMGDILFVEGHGNPDEVGRCAVWESQGQGVIHQNHLIRFRPNQSVALPDYVSAACNALRGRDSLQGLARTTSGLNTISTKDVKSLKIPLASMDRQRSFSVAAQRIKGINRQIALRRATLEELRSALQYRAFRGEL